ncbi:MAG: hypothetical protein HYY25_03470 [Candidatus Wallbacteria bacterium]|nr:hypothetical protein [Candidatus Wallbacteria bacterium]
MRLCIPILIVLVCLTGSWPAAAPTQPGAFAAPLRQAPPSFDQLALAETKSQETVWQAGAGDAAISSSGLEAERRRRCRRSIVRILLLVLILIVCLLALALASKSITLCLLERMIEEHERKHGCKVVRPGSCEGSASDGAAGPPPTEPGGPAAG